MFTCNVETILSSCNVLFGSNFAWSRHELLNRQSTCEPHLTYMIHACFKCFLITSFKFVDKKVEDVLLLQHYLSKNVKFNLWLKLRSHSIVTRYL